MCRMKTMFKSIALIAIAALSLAACSKNEAPINDENEMITLKFNIKNADDTATRALLGTDTDGKKFLNWENGDKIGSYSVGSFSQGTSSYSTSNNNAGTVEVSGDSYVLNVQAFYEGTITDLYTYYPYSSAAGKKSTEAIMTIPASQFMNVDGFDADAMPMAGTPVTVDLTTEPNKDVPCGTINFFNLGSIINFKIYSSTDTDETLTSVKYIAGTGNLGGNYTIDLTAIDGSNESTLALNGTGSDSEITTTHRAAPTIGTGKANAIDVYMVVAPGTYSGTQVVVTTSAKTYTLNASGEKTYNRSSVKPMYVDIQKGAQGELPEEETWTKVTKASDFTAGTYYILRADGAYYVPNGKGNPSCVAYTAGDAITNAMKWNATISGNGLIFESVAEAGNYLWTTNTGSSNTISVTESSTGANASNVWSFASITVEGTTYYTATAGGAKYLVSYGTSNWRYYATSNISTSNIPAEFYKLNTGDAPVPTTYSISIDEEIENGTVIASKTTEIEEGESITLTITPDDDYELETLIVDGENVTSDVVGDEYTFDMPAKDVSVTASFVLTQTSGNDGSLEHPYTASEAKKLALAGDTGTYYISGIISRVQNQFDANYGTSNFWISEDGESDIFEAYKIKYLGNVSWVDGNAKLSAGDEVIVNGTLTKYTSGSTVIPETSSGYLVSLNGKTKALSVPALTASPNDDNKEIAVSWTTATGTTEQISYAVTCGTQSYNATAAGSHTFTMVDYGIYTVTVVASASDAVSSSVTTNVTLNNPDATTKDYYKLVTSVNDITAGTYVVGALRSTEATNNFYFGTANVSSGDWVVSDNYVTVVEENGVRRFEVANLPSGAVEFTLTGNNTDGFTIANGSNYLYYTASSNRKLSFAASGSSQKWTIAAKSSPLINGGVYLSAVGGSYTVSENSTSTGAIRGYANTTAYRAIYLFKKVNE